MFLKRNLILLQNLGSNSKILGALQNPGSTPKSWEQLPLTLVELNIFSFEKRCARALLKNVQDFIPIGHLLTLNFKQGEFWSLKSGVIKLYFDLYKRQIFNISVWDIGKSTSVDSDFFLSPAPKNWQSSNSKQLHFRTYIVWWKNKKKFLRFYYVKTGCQKLHFFIFFKCHF